MTLSVQDGPPQDLYIAQLDSLSREMERAVHALAADRLPELEESLWKQEALCASLFQAVNDGLSPPSADSVSREALRNGYKTLLATTRRFSQVLLQAERSHKVLWALSATRGGGELTGFGRPLGAICSVEV